MVSRSGRDTQRAAHPRPYLSVAPKAVVAHGRRAIQIADRNGGIEVGDVRHDVEGPRCAFGTADDEPVVIHDTQHPYACHGFDGIEHVAVRLPRFADSLTRQIEEICVAPQQKSTRSGRFRVSVMALFS
jgi:hypothetical protein